MNDRRVHARWEQMEVVRYDRAGKWYLEPTDKRAPRQQVTIQGAADYAIWAEENRHGEVFFDVPGGGAFDRLLGPRPRSAS